MIFMLSIFVCAQNESDLLKKIKYAQNKPGFPLLYLL